MKKKLLISAFALFALTLEAQQIEEVTPSPWTIGITAGAVRTGLWNQPLQPVPCFEGCAVIEQTPLWTPSFNLDVGFDLNRRNTLMAGVGVGYLRYHEKGFASNGVEYFQYERDHSFGLINLQLGHRYRFLFGKKSHFFVDNRVVMDWNILKNNPEVFALRTTAFSYVGRVGYLLSVSSRHAFTVNAMFRTALVSYDPQTYDNFSPPMPYGMYPFGYGMEIGWVFRL
ncbi:MAG: hypothetical protein IT270_15575 [Saprospiraceae bacterium]|nr:hypothetical protein [Saprospiraceae bacterium]